MIRRTAGEGPVVVAAYTRAGIAEGRARTVAAASAACSSLTDESQPVPPAEPTLTLGLKSPPLERRIVDWLQEQYEPASTTAIHEAVGGARRRANLALVQLLAEGQVVRVAEGAGRVADMWVAA